MALIANVVRRFFYNIGSRDLDFMISYLPFGIVIDDFQAGLNVDRIW